jgi:hypothetical protein
MSIMESKRVLPKAPEARCEKERQWADETVHKTLLVILMPFLIPLVFVIALHVVPCFGISSLSGLGLADGILPIRAVGVSLVLTLFALLVPGMLISRAIQARAYIRSIPEGPEPLPSFMEAIQHQQCRQFLLEVGEVALFRRLGLAIAIVLGADYLRSELVPACGGLFCNRTLPILSAGIAGFLAYTLTEFINRYRTGNLSKRMYLPLAMRAVITLLLCAGFLLISPTLRLPASYANLAVGDAALVATAFVAGLIPDSALQAIMNTAKVRVDRFAFDPTQGYRALPEIELWDEVALVELGIDGMKDLAQATLGDVLICVGINPRLLLHAADRAILLQTFGSETSAPTGTPGPNTSPDIATRFAALPVYTASDLVLYVYGEDAYSDSPRRESFREGRRIKKLSEQEQLDRRQRVEGVLGVKDLSLQLHLLRTSANVTYIIENKMTYADL